LNTAYDAIIGIFPSIASPAAIPIMFCSATPVSMNLSGYFSANRCVFVDSVRSPVSAIIFLFFPSSSSPSPYPCLVVSVSICFVNRFLFRWFAYVIGVLLLFFLLVFLFGVLLFLLLVCLVVFRAM